jgi:hypothetical protein
MLQVVRHRPLQCLGVPESGDFDSRFSSREAAKNAKGKACYGFSALSLEEASSATEFRFLRGFA